MKKIAFTTALLAAALTAGAQGAFDKEKFSYETNMESRAAFVYNGEDLTLTTQQVNTNVYAAYGDHLAFRLRTRMYNWARGANFLDASDYLEFYYSPDENWTFAAGKGDNRLGSFEYDQRPINFYYLSEFSNNVGAFRWCASAERQAWDLGRVGVQVAQSMYAPDLIGYNLYLHRFTDGWSAMWSASYHEYAKGQYMGMIALGDEYNFGKFKVRVDALDRFLTFSDMKDYTISARATWVPCDRLQAAFEYSYDMNDSGFADKLVAQGTDISLYHLRIEGYPLKSTRNIRLHFAAALRKGDVGPVKDISSTSVQFGMSWRIIHLHNRNYLK